VIIQELENYYTLTDRNTITMNGEDQTNAYTDSDHLAVNNIPQMINNITLNTNNIITNTNDIITNTTAINDGIYPTLTLLTSPYDHLSTSSVRFNKPVYFGTSSNNNIQTIDGALYIMNGDNTKDVVINAQSKNIVLWTQQIRLGNADGPGKIIMNGGEQNYPFTNADRDKLNNLDTNWISSVDSNTNNLTTAYSINYNHGTSYKGKIGSNSGGLLIEGDNLTIDSSYLIVNAATVTFDSPSGSGIYLAPGSFWNFGTQGTQTRPYTEEYHNMNVNSANILSNRFNINSYRPNDWTPYGRPGIQPFLNNINYANTIQYNIFNQSEFNVAGLNIIQNGAWIGGSKRLNVKYCVNLSCNASNVLICKSRFRLKRNNITEGNNLFNGIQNNATNTLSNIIIYECNNIIDVINGDIIYLETVFNMTMQSTTTFTNWCSYQLTEI
jgi:hypothetical protein